MREKLGLHCDVISGYAFSTSDWTDFGVPVIKIGNISNGEDVITNEQMQYVDESFIERLDKKYQVSKGDVLISLTGSHINQPNSMVGRSCRSLSDKKYLLNQRAGKVIANKNTDIGYLYYLLSTKAVKYDIANRAYGGANQVNVSPKDIKNIKWEFPKLEEQNKIADILSTYDDLIENNNRRIALLEKAAQELYKEWFVRFRFPGYETTKFENGFPKGWNVVKLGDYVEIKGGKRLPEGKSLCEEKTNHPYIRIRDISSSKFVSLNKNFEYIDDETFDIINRFTVNSGDILISIVGTIGAIACVSNNLDGANLTENCVKLVNVEHFTNDYLYHFFNSEMGKGVIQAGIVGATQPKLPLYNIKRIKLLKPYKELIDMYSDKIKIIDQQIMCLMDKNQNLTKQRDLLLPRLMSGKLEM